MKNSQKYLENLIKQSINETLETKADELMGKIKEMEMEEGFDSPEIKMDRGGKDFNKDEFKKYRFRPYEFEKDYDLDSTTEDEFEYRYNTKDIDLDDELYGDEDDDFDFEVRDEDDIEPINEGETCEQCGGGLMEGKCVECGYKRLDEGLYDIDDIDSENEFDYVEEEEDKEIDIEAHKKELEKYCNPESIAFDEHSCNVNKKYFEEITKSQITEKWEGDVEVEKTGEYSDMTIEEINSAIKKLKKQNEKYQEEGKKVPQKNREKMSELYFAKRAKQGWKGKGKAAVEEEEVEEGNKFTGMLAKARKGDKFTIDGKTYTDTSDYDVKESIVYHIKDNQGDVIKLTENEMVDLIENIVNEQKRQGLKTIGKPKGLTTYEKAHKGSGKENEDYLKSVTKKMKDYLKDGSKGKYEMNPKMFPMGNGELGKMNKKAFKMTDELEDFNYEIAGQNFPTPDAIDYNEEWMEKLFKGDSMTGNAPGGNALESKTNERFNKMRKKNTLKKLKDQSYRRAPQPVFKEKSGDDIGKGLNIKLESTEDKNERVLNEEFERMKQLLNYSKKTQ